METLHLEVDPLAQFRMQPCRLIRSDILGPLKALIEKFMREGVLIPDISYTHASPLVIVQKKEGGIRMAVDYWEYLVYQPTNYPTKICCFSSLEVNNIMPKWITYGVIIN